MLNANHGFGAKAGGLLLAGGLALAGLAIAAPAAADEPETQTREVRTVIIKQDGNGPRKVTMRDGPAGKIDVDCPGSLTNVDVDTGATAGKKEQAKIVICSKTGSNEDIANGLERALANVEKNDDMDAELKSKLKARLQAKLAELRAAK